MDFELNLEPKGSATIECIVNGPLDTNTYFVISQGEAIAIDPAWDGERLARDFAAKHPDVCVQALVCTHGHGDHIGGIAGMKKALPEVLYLLPERDVAQVTESIDRQLGRWGIMTPDPGQPDRLLNEGDVVQVGDVELQIFSTPGHTWGGIVLFAATQEGHVAFVGDTLFPGSHGRTDLEGGDPSAMLRSLVKIVTLLPDDTLCLVGHGPSTTIGRERRSNPFIPSS